MIIVGGIILGVILLVAIGRFIGYMSNPARHLGGTYYNKDRDAIVLNKSGSCKIDKEIVDKDKVTDCTWGFNDLTNEVIIRYEYEYTSGYYYTYTYTDWNNYTLSIDDKNTLKEVYGTDEFTKEK